LAVRSMASTPGASEVPLVEPEEVRVMRELGKLGWSDRRIARLVGTGVMTVKRSLCGAAMAGVQTRPDDGAARTERPTGSVSERPGHRRLADSTRRLAWLRPSCSMAQDRGMGSWSPGFWASKGIEGGVRTTGNRTLALRAGPGANGRRLAWGGQRPSAFHVKQDARSAGGPGGERQAFGVGRSPAVSVPRDTGRSLGGRGPARTAGVWRGAVTGC
jgi:hypothetical protein